MDANQPLDTEENQLLLLLLAHNHLEKNVSYAFIPKKRQRKTSFSDSGDDSITDLDSFCPSLRNSSPSQSSNISQDFASDDGCSIPPRRISRYSYSEILKPRVKSCQKNIFNPIKRPFSFPNQDEQLSAYEDYENYRGPSITHIPDAESSSESIIDIEEDGIVIDESINHSGEPRPFKCHVKGCVKAYKNPGGLKYHVQRGGCEITVNGMEHIISRPFVCSLGCGKRYKNLNGLKYHLSHAHLDSPQSTIDHLYNSQRAYELSKQASNLEVDSLNGAQNYSLNNNAFSGRPDPSR